MRKPLRLLAAVAVAVIALAGCSGNGAERDTSADPELPSTSSSASPTTEADDGPELNSRGHIEKALGEEGGFCGDVDCSGPMAVTFTVDTITVDPPCSSDYAEPSENGHLVAISLRAATSPDLPSDMFVYFSAADFKVIGPDGLTQSGLDTLAAYSCVDERERFISEPLGPGQQYAGTIVIDSPTPTGALVYAPGGVDGGWEWRF